jgi:hypothetical protein
MAAGVAKSQALRWKHKQEAAEAASCNQKPSTLALDSTIRRIDRHRGYLQQLVPQAAPALAQLHLPLVPQPHLHGQVTTFLPQSHTPLLAQPQSQGQAALAQLHLPLVAQPHLHGQVTPFLPQSHTPLLAQPQSQGQPPAFAQQQAGLSAEVSLAWRLA